MRFFDLQTDFFIPLWRRYVLIAFCFGWGLIEFLTNAPFWGIIFSGMGVLAVWQLFFDNWPKDTADTNGQSDEE